LFEQGIPGTPGSGPNSNAIAREGQKGERGETGMRGFDGQAGPPGLLSTDKCDERN
jgi:hypothetical protein